MGYHLLFLVGAGLALTGALLVLVYFWASRGEWARLSEPEHALALTQ
jgi:hypothetical protein